MPTPAETDEDSPTVNGHPLMPTDSNIPMTDLDRIWECTECGMRGTKKRVFKKTDCDA